MFFAFRTEKNQLPQACVEFGILKNSTHGLRKLGTVPATEARSTVAQLEVRFGWNGGGMASHYTRSANRKRLAIQASEKLQKAQRENNEIPHLEKKT